MIAIRGAKIADRLGEDREIWLDTKTGLPFTNYTDGAFSMLSYLTPCCHAYATIFSDTGEMYCKKCYGDVDPFCGTGPTEVREP